MKNRSRARLTSIFSGLLFLTLMAASQASAIAAPIIPATSITAPTYSSIRATGNYAVTWAGSANAGVVSYDVQYKEPVSFTWLNWKPNTTATKAYFPGEPGKTHQFRARAFDKAGNLGPWSPSKETAEPFDHKVFTYSSGWKTRSNTAYYLGSAKYSRTKGSSAQFEFTGRNLRLFFAKGPAMGKATVYVRNKTSVWSSWTKITTVDLYSRSSSVRVPVSIKSWTTKSTHRVKVVVSGAKNRYSKGIEVALDGVAVRDAQTLFWPVWIYISPKTAEIATGSSKTFTTRVEGAVNKGIIWSAKALRDGKWDYSGAGNISSGGVYTAPITPDLYYVEAKSVADPMVINVAPVNVTGPPPPPPGSTAPHMTSISPAQGPAGASVTISGVNLASSSEGSPTHVYIGGQTAAVTSATSTSVTATVPGGWGGWESQLNVLVYMAVGSTISDNSLGFTVTGISPSPPELSMEGINAWGASDDNASAGDVVKLWGTGFSSTAGNNVVSFGGAQATALSYSPTPGRQGQSYITVRVPPGATTGKLRATRTDGGSGWGNVISGPVLDVLPPTVVTLSPGLLSRGIINPNPEPSCGAYDYREFWQVTGSGFSKLRDTWNNTGSFFLEASNGSVTKDVWMKAISDTEAVVHPDTGNYGTTLPHDLLTGKAIGTSITLKAKGSELRNSYIRTSGKIAVPYTDRAVTQGVWWMPARFSDLWVGGPSYKTKVPKGDLIMLTGYSGTPQKLRAPALWSGTLTFGPLKSKMIKLNQAGKVMIYNDTAALTLEITVLDEGIPHGSTCVSGDLATKGGTLAFGGGRLTIPPGALPLHDGSGAYNVEVSHRLSDLVSFDPTISDGGHMFNIAFQPKPATLLKPLTITVPYTMSGRAGSPTLGIFNGAGSMYGKLNPVIDASAKKATVVVPSGSYPAAAAGSAPASSGSASVAATGPTASSTVSAPSASPPPEGTLLGILAVLADMTQTGTMDSVARPLRVRWVTDPASLHYATSGQAAEVLAAAEQTYDNLESQDWKTPDARVTISLVDLGLIVNNIGTKGATTRAFLGQPWVMINRRLTPGDQTKMVTSHELGHVFQRQYTLNWSPGAKWIDEASSNWVAWNTFGAIAAPELQFDFKAAPAFPESGIPSGFELGWTVEEQYAAGAFMIWLADKYGDEKVREIYEAISGTPSNWFDSYGVLRQVTGASDFGDIAEEFGKAYWRQEFDPVRTANIAVHLRAMGDYNGVTGEVKKAYSSTRYDAKAADSFASSINGKDTVVRATGINGIRQLAWVYGDSATCSGPVGTLTPLAALSSTNLSDMIGGFGPPYACYRIVMVNRNSSEAPFAVRLVTPNISSLSPSSGGKAGGYDVTVWGSGFGSNKGGGAVKVWGFMEAQIVSWGDNKIVFKMPNMGATTGPISVKVVTDEEANTNVRDFTTY